MRLGGAARSAEGIIDAISRVLGIISIVFLLAMMLLTVSDVVLRKFFNSPIFGSVELIEIMMVITGFLGLAWCALKGGHIKVDLIVESMPRRWQGIIDSFIYILSFGICIILAWRSISESNFIREMNNTTPSLDIPLFPFYYVLTAGFTMLSLTILVLLVKSVKKALKK